MTPDAPPLVIRFGRLGDLVLLLPALAHLARRHGAVDLVTTRQYEPLLAALPDVRRTWALRGRQGAAGLRENLALADAIREAGHGPVYDLHASLRSRILTARLGVRVAGTVVKQSLDRRLRVGVRLGEGRLRLGRGSVRPFTRRFLDAVGAGREEVAVPRLPRALTGPGPEVEAAPLLALLPGARRRTKRWPPAAFGALARGWQRATGGRALVVHGPGEAALAREVVAAAGGAAEILPDGGLPSLVPGLARCRVAVGGDTGLLHLAAASGASPVGLFGPTGAAMGYWPWSDAGVALSPDMPCHPCTLYGSERCPLGHHACLSDLDPARVLAHARELLERR